LHIDKYTKRSNSSKPVKSLSGQDLPHSLLDTLSLEMSRLGSIGDKFETCLIEQKGCQFEWICEVDALRFLTTGL